MNIISQTLLGQLQAIASRLDNNKVAIGFEQIAVSSTAIPLTTIPKEASSALISVQTNPINFQEFGTPTTTVGHYLAVGVYYEITTAQNLNSIRFIATGSDAKINVTYYK